MSDDATHLDWRQAIVDPARLIEYALNARHPRGRHKARVFRSMLGFDSGNVGALVDALPQGVLRHPARGAGRTAFGAFYSVDIDVTGPSGTNGTIRTIWIVEIASSIPRLVMLYVRRR